MGLVTVKDLLRHEAQSNHQQSLNPPSSRPSSRPRTPLGTAHADHHTHDSTSSSFNGWQDSWADVGPRGEGHGLEIALEEGLAWVKARFAPLADLIGRFQASRSGSGRGGHDEAMQYELGDAGG